MKVLHLSITSDIGGGPEHVYQLISSFSNTFDFYIACPKNGIYFEKFQFLTRGQVTFLPYRRFKFKYLYLLYKYVKKNEIKILHSHGKGGGLYANLIKLILPVVIIHTPHGINQSRPHNFFYNFIDYINKKYLQKNDGIIYVSSSEFNYAQKEKLWLNIPYVIIKNGTKKIDNLDLMNLKSKRRNELLRGRSNLIIMATRFDFQKNTLEFCLIAKKLPEFTFLIIGDGEQMKACVEYCKFNKVENVIFQGKVNSPLDYIAASDLYLSTSKWEGLSMAILEAMSVGLPIIASNVVGNKDVVENGINGYLYDLGEIESAVKCIKLVFEKSTYELFSINSRKIHSEKYSSYFMASQTEKFYNFLTK